MLAFFICIILACILTFFFLKIYNFVSYKNQLENFKSATYIYFRKKIDFMPSLINEVRAAIGDTDEIIELIKIRNDFNEYDGIRKNKSILHKCNILVGNIFSKYPELLQNIEIAELKNTWYALDADLNSNAELYISAAESYNNMLPDFVCSKVAKIMGYKEEEL